MNILKSSKSPVSLGTRADGGRNLCTDKAKFDAGMTAIDFSSRKPPKKVTRRAGKTTYRY
jgi:hypothetical protein